ncbi:MAG: S9 family peptidase [Chloroflexota bacterium]
MIPEPPLIPRTVLFGNPVKANPQISPDGRRLAYLAPINNVLNVWVRSIDAEDDRVVTHDELRGVRVYFWGGDSQRILYLQDVGGDENWRLYGIDLNTGEAADLTPFSDVQVQIVERNKNYPNELLIAMNKEDPRVHDVYHLDLITGALQMVTKNPGDVTGWVADAHLKVRGAGVATPDGGFELMVREDEHSEWQKLVRWEIEDGLVSRPLGFNQEGNAIYLLDSRQVNAARLVKLSLASGRTEVLAEDPSYDVDNVIVHPDSHEVQAVSFLRARREWQVLDPSVADDFRAIGGLAHGDVNIANRDNDDQTWLVSFTADNGPVSYYAYDRSHRQATFLFHHQPELTEYTLAAMEPVALTARDGLPLHGYLTYPPGQERQGLPMVLNVHGGPWGRNTWGFDPEAQWFANRGYACLQINFRGSTGYGKGFLNAGDREWGAKMHDDLVDAVQWAVEQGIADPQQVAIYGGSYGGYAALVGATFTPDLFCCAVDVVGPSNLITLIKTIPPYWSTFVATFHQRVGNPDTEEEFLRSRSPLFKVDQIKIPMLIAQGANDPRVKQAESEQIVAAMQQKGIDYEYLLFPDEGHGFARPENRLKFYAAAEKFLAKHLGGRYEEGNG